MIWLLGACTAESTPTSPAPTTDTEEDTTDPLEASELLGEDEIRWSYITGTGDDCDLDIGAMSLVFLAGQGTNFEVIEGYVVGDVGTRFDIELTTACENDERTFTCDPADSSLDLFDVNLAVVLTLSGRFRQDETGSASLELAVEDDCEAVIEFEGFEDPE